MIHLAQTRDDPLRLPAAHRLRRDVQVTGKVGGREMERKPQALNEAPNPDLWARSPYDVAREGVELTRKLLHDIQ